MSWFPTAWGPSPAWGCRQPGQADPAPAPDPPGTMPGRPAGGRRPARDRSVPAAVGIDRKGGLDAGVRPGENRTDKSVPAGPGSPQRANGSAGKARSREEEPEGIAIAAGGPIREPVEGHPAAWRLEEADGCGGGEEGDGPVRAHRPASSGSAGPRLVAATTEATAAARARATSRRAWFPRTSGGLQLGQRRDGSPDQTATNAGPSPHLGVGRVRASARPSGLGLLAGPAQPAPSPRRGAEATTPGSARGPRPRGRGPAPPRVPWWPGSAA